MSANPQANPTIVLREEFDDYALLYNPDSIEVFCLNPVGVRIWKQLDGRHSPEEILEDLKANCNNVPGDAGDHLREFVGELTRRGLLESGKEQGA